MSEKIRSEPDGVGLIATERLRQVMQEGWTAEHDDEHSGQELARAAELYVRAAVLSVGRDVEGVRRIIESYGKKPEDDLFYQRMCENPARHHFGWDDAPRQWPLDKEWWKPSSDPIRNLVKAGALIAAEIDRLQRLKAPEQSNA